MAVVTSLLLLWVTISSTEAILKSAEQVPDCGFWQDTWREVMEINRESFFFLGGTFVQIYNIIELRDQESFAQFVSIDISRTLRLHAWFFPYCRCFCRTGECFHTPAGKAWPRIRSKVKTWSGWTSLMYSAHTNGEIRREGKGREGGWHWPPNAMKGVARHCHGNPAPEMFDFDQLWCSDESCACLFLPGDGTRWGCGSEPQRPHTHSRKP